jgi:hypothetical protein
MIDDTDDPSSDSLDTVPRIQIRVPGPWTEPAELHAALTSHSTGYDLTENGLVDLATGRHFRCSATPPDTDIAGIFAGSGRLSPREIDAIAAHNVKVHLSAPGGSVEAAREMLKAATALINAGGTGVMIDNAAITHGKADWLKLAADKQAGGLYWTFVALTHDDEMVWSCGMHCLGLRDAELPDPPGRQEGAFIVHNFLGYTYQSGITVLDGEALGDENGPMFHVRHMPHTRFKPGAPFHNPYGVWRLEAATE